jgi:hypothetical protein
MNREAFGRQNLQPPASPSEGKQQRLDNPWCRWGRGHGVEGGVGETQAAVQRPKEGVEGLIITYPS